MGSGATQKHTHTILLKNQPEMHKSRGGRETGREEERERGSRGGGVRVFLYITLKTHFTRSASDS